MFRVCVECVWNLCVECIWLADILPEVAAQRPGYGQERYGKCLYAYGKCLYACCVRVSISAHILPPPTHTRNRRCKGKVIICNALYTMKQTGDGVLLIHELPSTIH